MVKFEENTFKNMLTTLNNELGSILFKSKYVPKFKKVIRYMNLPVAFDIETTSTELNNEKFSFMYEWTFGLKDLNYIVYGRTWEEFKTLCRILKREYHLGVNRIMPVYVHNLSFEFQFMRKLFNWKNTFNTDDRKPIKGLTSFGLEFRDSYILSGYSLEKTADNLTNHNIKKLVGELDYTLVRTPETYLTDDELSYCENDVGIILAYIQEQIDMYDNDITKIPLTNTGRVRRFVRDRTIHSNKGHKKDSSTPVKRYRQQIKESILNEEQYVMLKQAFAGGYTHGSMQYVGELLKDVYSIDFTSSYPYCMLSEKFPIGKPVLTDPDKVDDYINSDDYCLLLECSLEDLHSNDVYECYLSESKCRNIKGGLFNNGRIFSADYLETTITDIDLEIIKQNYSDSLKITILKAYRFYKQYLPRLLILAILELYENKTVLKGIKGKEVEYQNSKGMLNSVYGMAVTDIIRDEFIYIDHWDIEKANIQKQLDTYNKGKNRFLYYPWGVWITAYARRNLWEGINAMGSDYVYSDTDSIKFLNYDAHKDWIEGYNKRTTIKLQKMCEYNQIDISLCSPKTQKGIPKPIGVFDYEGRYPLFKTLGAKRYMYTDEDDTLHITVAGLSKQNGVYYLLKKYKDIIDVFKHFNDELFVPADETGKLTHTYIDHEMEGNITDYTGKTCYVKSLSGVHLSNCDFTLSISLQHKKFIEDLRAGYIYAGEKYL